MHFFEKLHFLDKMFLKVEKLFWYPSYFPKKWKSFALKIILKIFKKNPKKILKLMLIKRPIMAYLTIPVKGIIL